MTRRCKAVSVKDIQSLDRRAIDRLGIPSLVLMENAGRAVAEEAVQILKTNRRARISIVCGTGNNGGDGLVAARHLLIQGFKVSMFVIGSVKQLKPDTAVNYAILRKSGCSVTTLARPDKPFSKALKSSSVIIDALFGVGLNRPLTGPFIDAIGEINASGAKIISADIPSGLDGDTGEVFGACVRADTTVTFSCPKQGMSRGKGPLYTGKIVVAPIGIPHGCHQ